MPVIKHILVCFFVTLSLSQYSLVKTISNITPYQINDAATSTTGDFTVIRGLTSYFILNSTFDQIQTGIGIKSNKIVVADNIFTVGPTVWGRKGNNFQNILNVTGMVGSRPSKNGLVVAGFNINNLIVTVWTRKTITDDFTLNCSIVTNEAPVDIIINQNGSILVVATVLKIYIYKNTGSTYQIFDMFSHGILNDFFLYPQLVASSDFSLLLARGSSKIKCYNFAGGSFQLFKNLTFSSMVDWTLDNNHLILKEYPQNVRILKRGNLDFIDVQNLTTTIDLVQAKNGILIIGDGPNATNIQFWKSIKSEQNQLDEAVES